MLTQTLMKELKNIYTMGEGTMAKSKTLMLLPYKKERRFAFIIYLQFVLKYDINFWLNTKKEKSGNTQISCTTTKHPFPA